MPRLDDVTKIDLHARAADVIAGLAVPANILIWFADIDIVLRALVTAGSLVLIVFAIVAKVRQWRKQ